VLSLLSNRLLPLLQLTRLALVFTAIADGWCNLLLLTRQQVGPAGSVFDRLGVSTLLLVAGISIGLYAFGMSLNDLIDRRRDVAIAPNRPLPSGRVSPVLAQNLCMLLLAMALGCGFAYAQREPIGWLSLVLLVFTAMLIGFYDLAGKYLVAPGLISLGLIRFFHSLIVAPQMPVVWQPLLLLDHVAIVSAVAYAWEQKRPALRRRDVWLVVGGLIVLNAMVIGLVLWRRLDHAGATAALRLDPGLLLPIAAVAAFILTAIFIRLRAASSRQAGQQLMLTGLLWLIVYDAAFVGGYVSLAWAGAIALLLPVAYVSVLVMRWWSTIVGLSQRPAFKRAQ
jgi:4-hydroxybenzoate polyprenyltransferase